MPFMLVVCFFTDSTLRLPERCPTLTSGAIVQRPGSSRCFQPGQSGKKRQLRTRAADFDDCVTPCKGRTARICYVRSFCFARIEQDI